MQRLGGRLWVEPSPSGGWKPFPFKQMSGLLFGLCRWWKVKGLVKLWKMPASCPNLSPLPIQKSKCFPAQRGGRQFLIWRRFQNRHSRSCESFSGRVDKQVLSALEFKNTNQREKRSSFWVLGIHLMSGTLQVHSHPRASKPAAPSTKSSHAGPHFSSWASFQCTHLRGLLWSSKGIGPPKQSLRHPLFSFILFKFFLICFLSQLEHPLIAQP